MRFERRTACRVGELRAWGVLCRGAGAPGLLLEAYTSFLSGESSRRGKAGALWETAFPLLHPLPSPRSTPSFEVSSTRRIPSRSAFRESLRYGYPAPRAAPQHTHHAGLTTRGLQAVRSPGEKLRERNSLRRAFGPGASHSRRFGKHSESLVARPPSPPSSSFHFPMDLRRKLS